MNIKNIFRLKNVDMNCTILPYDVRMTTTNRVLKLLCSQLFFLLTAIFDTCLCLFGICRWHIKWIYLGSAPLVFKSLYFWQILIYLYLHFTYFCRVKCVESYSRSNSVFTQGTRWIKWRVLLRRHKRWML